MRGHALAFGIILLASASCNGCNQGPTVDDVCDALRDCPDGIGADCVADGHKVETMADNANCPDTFSDYLQCLDDADCDWRSACEPLRKSITECVGELPP